jgi:GT2 family glycosyltransferase
MSAPDLSVIIPAFQRRRMTSRKLFDEINGFDNPFQRCQDVDLCWRAHLSGHTMGLVPGAVVAKRAFTSPRANFRQYSYGRFAVLLFRECRSRGIRRPAWPITIRSYLGIVPRLGRIGRGETREWLVRQLGRPGGRLAGSLHYRVFVP